ncbi:helix-turn-helix domain-containing protein [Intestinimonas butyriciproducens]|uniref:helix-turn-helix domain-containing protein n=1 Tax=Intestinimonas butyriciproducens TaxID=1297617 RepID=UPI001FAF1839|nr:helix-turn-helix transcriptional regulator [Intestinimonas butyriciproducens]
MRTLRKAKKATQEDLAHLLGVTTNHYQKIEYGQINLSVTALDALADYFGVSADYLLGRSEDQ